jgi:hypothetical protein
MGDYFDEDDLINDYMEEDEAPPDEMIDEAYFMEECDAAIEPRQNVLAAVAATIAQPNEVSTEEMTTSIPECLPEEITMNRRPKQDYLYSFER